MYLGYGKDVVFLRTCFINIKGGAIQLIGCSTVQDHHLSFFAPQFSTRLLLNYSRSFGFSLKKCTFWDAMHIFSAIFLQTHVLLSRATFVFCDHTSVWFCSFQAQHKKQEKFLLPNFLVRNSVWKHCERQQMVAFNSSGSNYCSCIVPALIHYLDQKTKN